MPPLLPLSSLAAADVGQSQSSPFAGNSSNSSSSPAHLLLPHGHNESGSVGGGSPPVALAAAAQMFFHSSSSVPPPPLWPAAAAVEMAPNCSYRYDLSDNRTLGLISLWLDGPITIVAALLALVGCHFAVRFLARAGLNRELTAALYTLCICDSFLISMVVIYHSIEACSVLLLGHNMMWDEQSSVLITHGIVSATTTASTLLVVFITFQRFLVVWWPLRYAKIREPKRKLDSNMRKSSSSCNEDTVNTEISGLFRPSGLVRTLSKRLLHGSRKKPADLKRFFRPFLFPMSVIIFSFLLNFSVFFEFELVPCFAQAHNAFSMQLFPSSLRQSQMYNMFRTVIFMSSQTIGPILCISLLTIITEYKVHVSLKARRILFESQNRRRSVVALEELKEKVSRTVAIFIAIKFLILRSMPIFFDIYETFYGIDSFGIVLSVLVRLSDFGVVLNSATNSLAYFGKTEFFANRLRGKLLKEKQHFMVAKAASACLVVASTPTAIPRSGVKNIRSLPFTDLALRRHRKTVTYGGLSGDSPSSAVRSVSATGTPQRMMRNSHSLSMRNGVVHHYSNRRAVVVGAVDSPLARNAAAANATFFNSDGGGGGEWEHSRADDPAVAHCQQQKMVEERMTQLRHHDDYEPNNSETASEPLSDTPPAMGREQQHEGGTNFPLGMNQQSR